MLDHAAIRRLLPHAHPMLLVDRVDALEPGVSIVGVKAVTDSEPCYRDVPRGAPADGYAYPVSLLLESFGQTAAVLWLCSDPPSVPSEDRVVMLVTVRDARLTGRAFPGDVLRHVARIDQVVADSVFVSGEVLVGDRRIATIGSMMAVRRPWESVRSRRSTAAP